MTRGVGPVRRMGGQLTPILLIAVPLIVFLCFASRPMLRSAGLIRSPDAELRLEGVATGFEALLRGAGEHADAALRDSPDQALRDARQGRWRGRVEGAGVLDEQGRVEDWAGAPADAPQGPSSQTTYRIVHSGVRTRLLVRSPTDPSGRSGWVSFLLDSSLGDLAFSELLSPSLLDEAVLDVEFFRPQEVDPPQEWFADPPTVQNRDDAPSSRLLLAPGGGRMGRATLHVIPTERSDARLREVGAAWAVSVFLLLLAFSVDWGARTRTPSGLALTLLALGAGRAALLAVDAASLLLPREHGTATRFGAPEAWGLIGSPADLLLTALTLYVVCRALLAGCDGVGRDHPRAMLAVAGLLGAGTTVLLFGLTVSVARNSRFSLMDRPGELHASAQTIVTVGLVLAMLAAARPWAFVWDRLLPDGPTPARGRLANALVLIGLSLACSVLLQNLTDRLAVERLESEFAPQILEQSSRRSVALSDAVRHVGEVFDDPRTRSETQSAQPDYLAYHFWVNSELFGGGYKSSLDFHTARGPVSHFGFGLPSLEEDIDPAEDAPRTLRVRRESFAAGGASRRSLLHAELPIYRDGELLGAVVGHILDEPENLPFLPESRPHLAALGPGSSRHPGEGFHGGPHYVLYDSAGTVRLTTIGQPPALSDTLRSAAGRGERVRIRAGDDTYRGLALESDGQFHLLLIAVPDLLDRLAASAKLALFALLILLSSSAIERLLRSRFPFDLASEVRGSFRRKLLAAMLVASVVPLVGLALFLRGYIESRGDVALRESATQMVGAARRVLEDYAEVQTDGPAGAWNDEVLYWLGGVVDHEIHLYRDGELIATSTRELFSSGLLPPRLDGLVQRRLVHEGLPHLMLPARIGPGYVPVAYAPVRGAAPGLQAVVAVPLTVERDLIARSADRVVEMILLSTVALVALLAVAAAWVARTVSRPVRDLVEATERIASGDYATRLVPRTQDEIADLVGGFNRMAGALAGQRADLERRRDYIETLLRLATTGVISTDPGGRVVTVNPAALELLSGFGLQLPARAALVKTISRSEALRPLGQALAGAAAGRSEPVEVDLEHSSGARRFRLVHVDLPDAAGGTVGSLILLDDVTELMRSNQLAAWAEMARAIAHEIKNPLTPIQLSAEHLRRVLRDQGVLPSPEIESCLDTVIKQVRTLYEIAEEFSAYAKLPALEPISTDPVAFMRETIDPYRSVTERGVVIEERFDPTPAVAIDRRVLSRAVVNLIENALQAMPEGGRLTLSVRAEGREVLLGVADTGVGLEPEARRRLFEPYFSTKSSGTGLGLAIARRAVEGHQGKIEVARTTEHGTAFLIRLPQTS